jgi:hypothetical protein
MFFGFPRRNQVRLFSTFRVDNKQKPANPADCLPPRFARCVAFATVNTLNAIWIGEHELSIFKADFVLQLVFGVLVLVPYDPTLIHVFSVLLFALLVKGFLKVFYLVRGFMRRMVRERRGCSSTGPPLHVYRPGKGREGDT